MGGSNRVRESIPDSGDGCALGELGATTAGRTHNGADVAFQWFELPLEDHEV